MFKAVVFVLISLISLFIFFDLRTSFSLFSFSYELFQPQNIKGVIKVGVYVGVYVMTLITLLLLLLFKNNKLYYVFIGYFSFAFLVDSTYYFNGLIRGFSTDQFVTVANEKSHIMAAVASYYGGFFKALGFLFIFLGFAWLIRRSVTKRFSVIPLLLLLLSFGGAKVITNVTVDSIHNFPPYVKLPLVIFNAYEWGLMNIPFMARNRVNKAPINSSEYKHIVLIVDESVRGDYLSLNGYDKPTTPYLDSLGNDRLLNLGVVSSVANNSANTNYILRNGILVDELPDKKFKTLAKPTIFQFAKKAGFSTYFLDAQSSHKGLQNNMSSFDLSAVDHFMTLKNKDDYAQSDRILLNKYIKLRKQSEANTFTYFVKYGSHFKWKLTYPQSSQIFEPVLGTYDSLSFDNRDKAINTYLNSLKWGVDDFFKDLVSVMKSQNTLIIYTSDHGQNIIENNTVITHGLDANPPSTMANVPLFFYSNKLDSFKVKFDSIQLNSYSQYQLFPTILSLLGYGDKVVNQYGKPFWEGEVDANKRVFFSGTLFGNGRLNSFK